MAKAKPAAGTERLAAKLRDPTPGEAKAISVATDAQAERPARPEIGFEIVDAIARVTNPHSDPEGAFSHLYEAFGTTSAPFVHNCIGRLQAVLAQTGSGQSMQDDLNAAFAMVAGLEPQNEGQAAVAVQIVANHIGSMQLTAKALRYADDGHIEAANLLTNMAAKLSRTMVAHVEALAKLRGGGRQIVEHRYIQVNGNAVVGDGTQAVFGGVNPQGGNNGSERQPQGTAGGAGLGPALLGPQSPGETLPEGCDARAEEMPQSRGQEHRRSHRPGKRPIRARPAHQGNGDAAGAVSDAGPLYGGGRVLTPTT
jgi:hypothetical protein